MINIEEIKKSGYFNEISLKKGELLFSEWDVDENLYIVYDGELSIEKEINTKKWEFKLLSLLGPGNFVWESALSHSNPKEVRIRAKRDTQLLYIEWKKEFPKFVTEFPKIAYWVLISIIDISNSRLLRANREVTANYEVNIAISKIKDISITSINKLLLVFESILQVDQIMFFEKNIVMDNYYKLKYDSKNEKCLQNKIIKFPEETFSSEKLLEEDIATSRFLRHTKLRLWGTNYGFLAMGREKKDFNENEEKLLHNIASSFVWIIHQKELLDEQRDKSYIKSWSSKL